ncbi:hypothetical protein FH972_025775 [Carpinus fangiana]|uniref:Uncharacterized protein n=1 Tax=Carpinus fangiana TaxID=176857 RepID=A0A5N6L202_9ROSI|nr:hypothetical protein FH972_025775 [Carpinus fangiana]
MEGRKKKPEATPPQAARVLKLLDEPKESKEPKDKDGLATFLAPQWKTGSKLVIYPVATYKAFLFEEPIAVKPLIEMESKDSAAGWPNQTKAPALVQEKETRPRALSPIAEAKSQGPSPIAEVDDLEDEASSTYTPIKHNGMEWTVGKPLSKLGGKLAMNHFQALVESFPMKKFFDDSSSKTEALKTKLATSEAENSKLKETLAQQDKELLLVGQQQSSNQEETSETAVARAKDESKISELTVELENLLAAHGQLQEDHSILKEDLSQLEERHAEVLEKMKGIQTEAVEERKPWHNRLLRFIL